MTSVTVRGLGFLVMLACAPVESRTADTPVATGSAIDSTSFINRVWAVAESPQIEIGSLRVFLSEGTLVMASRNAKPAFGSWSYRDGRLTITEESLTYQVDILELDHDTFRIRIHNPGEPVDIRFEPAARVGMAGR